MGRSLLFFAAAALLAQKSDQPVIRVTTRLVEINVIARDKGGPVRDLTQDDFVITEKGKPRKIAFFSKNEIGPAAMAASVPPLPAGIVTNRLGGNQPPPVSVAAILLDTLNTDVKDQDYARQQFLAYLKQIRPEDRIAVYILGSKLWVLNDFTSDARRLTAAVSKFTGEANAFGAPSSDMPTGVTGGSDDVIMESIQNATNDMVSDRNIRIRAETTAAAMEAIANHLSRVAGRKSLIWISSSFPFVIGHMGDGQDNSEDNAFDNDINGVTAGKRGGGGSSALYNVNDRGGNPARTQMNFAKEFERATRALNNSNIAVYPVDARGLTTLPKSMTAEHNFGVPRASAAAPPQNTSMINTGSTAMHALADNTGGIIFENGNDLRKAIQTAVQDGEVTYTIGFYPDSAALDAKFHDLKVQVKRKDVELRYRRGYMALPETTLTAKDRADQRRDALSSPLLATGITLTAGSDKGEKAGSLRVVVAIDPHDITLEQKDGKFSGELELVFSQRAGNGTVLATSTTPLGLAMDQKRFDQIFQKGLSITKNLDVAAGAVEVRILVSDRATGRIGTLVLPVK